ncbi:AsnC family protein [Thermoanaerobacterium thermosaccharolyticum]|uniref:AsnC family protein n=1 Tax=Thermoanaerobacterium thermosaccharolyticum TaxID=1517 RepID=UPI002FD9CB4E
MNNDAFIKRGNGKLTVSYGESLLININPDKNSFDKTIDDDALLKKKRENNFLILLLNNFVNQCYRYKVLIKEGYFFILCDKDGYVIKIIANDQLNKDFKKLQFREGISLRLEDSGTNAVNIAMEYKSLAQLYGKDHYCDLFKDWYCTAMPITDHYSKEIVAYLDISRINVPSIKEQSISLKNIAIYLEKCISYRSENMSFVEEEIDDTDKLILSSLVRNGVRKAVMDEVGISDRTLRNHLNKLGILFDADNDIKIIMTAINIGIIDTHGNIL